MATTKTLTPTNQTITIDAFQGEKPDHRHVADAEGKLADAVNALNSKMANEYSLNWGTSLQWQVANSLSVLFINATFYVQVWTSATSDIAVFVITQDGVVYRKGGTNGVVKFGLTATSEDYVLTRNGTTVTLTAPSNCTSKVIT